MDEHPSDLKQETLKNTLLYHYPALVPTVTGWLSVKFGLQPNYLDLISEGKNEACDRAPEASADLSDFFEQPCCDCPISISFAGENLHLVTLKNLKSFEAQPLFSPLFNC
jgi:hypothetical protein